MSTQQNAYYSVPKTSCLVTGASAQCTHSLNYLVQQKIAGTSVAHGKMKCQLAQTEEPKAHCANPAKAALP